MSLSMFAFINVSDNSLTLSSINSIPSFLLL
ncbi:hypothetical protein XBO1_790003 [Xenorhabdus bovienii str. oregonense]|uniref:Uncharacterized protein n=1 Tax=Xenorhabdus bovienii str. oregonense TaxID=1398202 RepID=A0A077PE35_XENBV|nr:hypothetical protein XBO1_790003 [Xenorhabdus bovienii str. oregonense]